MIYTAISLQGANHFLGSDKTWGYLRISCQKTKYHSIADKWRQVQLFDNVENCQIRFGHPHDTTEGPMIARFGRW